LKSLLPKHHYVLPDELRPRLAEPFGAIVDNAGLLRLVQPEDVVFAVGDVVSLSLQGLGITPQLFVCDYKTQRGAASATYREALASWGETEFQVVNPAGTVTREAWQAVRKAVKSKRPPVRIVVDGEEDLLAIPCFLEAPDGSVVVYGAPGRGAVVCRVGDELRQRAMAILAHMPVE